MKLGCPPTNNCNNLYTSHALPLGFCNFCRDQIQVRSCNSFKSVWAENRNRGEERERELISQVIIRSGESSFIHGINSIRLFSACELSYGSAAAAFRLSLSNALTGFAFSLKINKTYKLLHMSTFPSGSKLT